MVNEENRKRVRLYALGGAGINVGSSFVKYEKKGSEGFAKIETVFVDTSKSNISSSIPVENIYLVDNLDGSGKIRASNYEALLECSKEILHKHRPGDVNVVLHSTGGGTGSTIGPIIVSELLARGENVIVIMTGSTSSRIETENTLKTLKSYEVISNKRQIPVIAAYRENTQDKPRGMVDSEVQTLIVFIAAIFSGQNRELDMSDLRNFLQYNKVTSYAPKLSLFEVFTRNIILTKGQTLVSLATLIDEKSSSDVDVHPEYQAVGFISQNTKEAMTVDVPIHACVISGYFNGIADRLNQRLVAFDEVRKVVVEKSIVHRDDQSTDDGLVL